MAAQLGLLLVVVSTMEEVSCCLQGKVSWKVVMYLLEVDPVLLGKVVILIFQVTILQNLRVTSVLQQVRLVLGLVDQLDLKLGALKMANRGHPLQ